jgi:competence protein ComFC
VHNLLKPLLNIFYPLYCGGCNAATGNILCDDCINTFQPVENEKTCPICGRLIGKSILCGACIEEKRTFSKGHFGYYFEGRLRDVIHAFKFDGRIDAGKYLVSLLKKKIDTIAKEIDCIIPLPVTEKRLKERGFNQSFIIGEEIAKITGKEIYPSVLVKAKQTEDQYALSKKERKKNISGAFAVKNNSRISGKKVLLVDDLFTTGYTAQEASRSLLKSSAKEVIFFALARTPS